MSTIQTLTDLEIAEVSGAGLSLNMGGLLGALATSSFSYTKTNADGSSTSIDFDNSVGGGAEGFFSLLFGKHCGCGSTSNPDDPSTGV
jgi:hypothetical protein